MSFSLLPIVSPGKKEMTFHLIKSPLCKDALCKLWLKLAMCFWRRSLKDIIIFDALCQVSLKFERKKIYNDRQHTYFDPKSSSELNTPTICPTLKVLLSQMTLLNWPQGVCLCLGRSALTTCPPYPVKCICLSCCSWHSFNQFRNSFSIDVLFSCRIFIYMCPLYFISFSRESLAYIWKIEPLYIQFN